ncbi:hypothetical protein GU926_08110 [Nibribacter ruber]|uniref:Uncharacterized protein n=1 Tax=Nibribacter ruber TaxID=2698458 RepID=A0A6P1NYU8_9BACT|nr:hypothetical protein [Nibribacter ruber]QHL87399.1 hypothetical protein GU926_08110 [Nibribacter ruber]
MEEAKTQREISQEWLALVIQNWRQQLKKLRIKSTGDLDQSFAGEVMAHSNGDVEKIKIAYAWYGAMVDMGVGRGSKLGDQKENATSRRILGKARGNRRAPKRWYSKGRDSIGHQVNQLSHLLADKAAIQGVENVAGSIQKKLVINI